MYGSVAWILKKVSLPKFKFKGENLGIFAGDSEGSMLIFRAPENWRHDCVFELAKKAPSPTVHRIGILQILLVVQENFVFTISFDQQLKGFDATNGGSGKENLSKYLEFFCIKNPNKVIYTSIHWDQ
jgi:WD40 repeat protein